MGKFTSDLTKFHMKVMKNHEKIFRWTVISLAHNIGGTGQGIIPDTPVETGLAKNNWMTSLGMPSIKIRENPDPEGRDAILNVHEIVNQDLLGKTVYIVNNLPYIRRLENGWSKLQAPHGMVAINVERFKEEVNRVVKLVRK